MRTAPAGPSAQHTKLIRDRGDACPGALRLHEAADGALARVRIPGGLLGVRQAAGLADAARRFGDGELHLTSRGNVQLRGLRPDCGRELADLLQAAGLLPSRRHERVRNVVASPLAGIDSRGRGDLRPWLRALDEALCGSEFAHSLSGRFLFALDDGRGDTAELEADLTLTAGADGHALLRIGPPGHGSPSVRVPCAQAPRAAVLAAEAFLHTPAAQHGQAWRVAELPGGPHELTESVLSRLDSAGIAAEVSEPGPPPRAGASQAPPLGVLTGPGGAACLSVLAELGTVDAAQWEVLTAAGGASGELRLTPWRGVVVPGLAANEAPERLREAAAAGLITDSGSPRAGVSACAGRPGCAKSLADVRGDAGALTEASGLPVHWSGCERRCGRPRGDRIEAVAVPGGYRIWAVRQGAAEPAVTAGRAEAAARVARARTAGTGRAGPARPVPAAPPSPTTGESMSETSVFDYEKDGAAIYRQSFATIRAEADLGSLPPDVAQVAVRMIHACGMTDLVADLAYSPAVVRQARAALQSGAPILCDAAMVASGVTRKRLPAGNDVVCTLADPSVPDLAAKLGTTRTAAALELWRERMDGAVVAVGNAPTALFRLLEMIEEGAPRPAAVIGVPVGFVGAAESKDALASHPSRCEHLIVSGRRGGSAIAAAALNAIASEEE